jgi:hypothetical protein
MLCLHACTPSPSVRIVLTPSLQPHGKQNRPERVDVRTATTVFHALPTELWLHLCSFLDVQDFVSLCSTSRDLHAAGQDEWVWRSFLLRDSLAYVTTTSSSSSLDGTCFLWRPRDSRECGTCTVCWRRSRPQSTTSLASTTSKISSVGRGSGSTAARWCACLYLCGSCPRAVISRCLSLCAQHLRECRSTFIKTRGT